MKVTTVRFGEDLWALLEHEAARAGVSVSQYVREAALARAAFAAGARADVPRGVPANRARGALDASADDDTKRASADRLIAALGRTQEHRDRARTHRRSTELSEETAALQAQARQTARHAQELRRRRPEPEPD
jgi:Ribbon-helix-helix protein, copG family